MARCLACGRRFRGAHDCAGATTVEPDAGLAPEIDQPTIPGYSIEALLGRGGFGAVWAARSLADDARAAIKVARRQPFPTARLANEAQALKAIGPPAVPALVDEGLLPDGSRYLVMERIAAPTLASWMLVDRRGALAPFTQLAERLLDALSLVHARGFVHRDLKPENILYDEPGGVVRLIDFGLVKTTRTAAPDITIGSGVGSVEYMAPEQWDGGAHDGRIDIYAVGVILYELWTGRVPFVSAHAAELQEAHRSRRPPPPSEILPTSPALEEVLLRCLAKEADGRFADVGELRSALAEALGQRGLTQVRNAPPSPRVRDGSRSRRHVALLFADSPAPIDRLSAEIKAGGGRIALVDVPRYVFVFESEPGEHPVSRALHAARGAFGLRLLRRAVVDVGSLMVLRSLDGTARYLGPALAQLDRYAPVGAPPGLFATPMASAALPDLPSAPAGELLSLTEERAAEITTPYDGEGPLVGRDELLTRILAEVRAAVASASPSMTTVIAEAGHGKSRFAAALAAALRASDPSLALRRISASEGAREEAGTLRALASTVLQLPPSTPADEACRRLARALGDGVWQPAALAIGWLAADDPSVRNLAAAPGALRAAAARAVGELLLRASQAGPLCVILDDAQFADHTALDAIEYAMLSDGPAALWACVLARPSFERARQSWGARAARHVRHDLPSLSPEDAALLCRQLLRPASYVPEPVIRELTERTRGVPLMLAELVRGLKREGLVRRHAHGHGWYIATDEIGRILDLPLIEWLAERELRALPAELGAHARLASLLGSEFTRDELEGVMAELDRDGAPRFELDAGAALRRLANAGVLINHRQGRASFRHALVREAVARAVPAELRQRVHRAAYRHYSRQQLDVATRTRLAHHAAATGLHQDAAQHYLTLADDARRRQAYVEAETLYSRALDQLDEGEPLALVRVYAGRAQMRHRVNRLEDALDDLARAQRLVEPLGDPARLLELLLDEATIRDWIDDYRCASTLVARAVELSRAVEPSPLIRARLLAGQGRALWRSSRWSEAGELLGRATALAETLGDDGYETLIESLLMRGEIVTYVGRVDEANQVFERAIALTLKYDDRFHRAGVLNNRRGLWIARKDGERAIQDMYECMRLAREGGVMTLEFFAQYNVAELSYQLGRAQASIEVQRAIELQARRLGTWARPVALLLRARLLAHSGAVDAARSTLAAVRAAEECARNASHPEGQLLDSERVLADMVDLATSAADESAWDALIERSRRFSVEQEPIEVVEMRALAEARAGRHQAARRWLDEAAAMAARMPTIMNDRIARARDSI